MSRHQLGSSGAFLRLASISLTLAFPTDSTPIEIEMQRFKARVKPIGMEWNEFSICLALVIYLSRGSERILRCIFFCLLYLAALFCDLVACREIDRHDNRPVLSCIQSPKVANRTDQRAIGRCLGEGIFIFQGSTVQLGDL